MGYLTEVTITEDDFNGLMDRMRAWLDHRRFEPASFTLSYGSGRKGIRVLFKSEGEAAAFAAEFGATQLSSPTSDTVAA